MMRVLLDTNILLDYFAHRDPHYQSARKLMLFAALGEFELWASSSQLTDVFYLLTSGQDKLSSDEAKESLQRLRRIVHVCSMGEEEVDAALLSAWEDFEDACVFQIALKVKAEAIASRNAKDFIRSPIRVLSCEELFAHIEKEKGISYDEIVFPS